jgi:hypothetical protein
MQVLRKKHIEVRVYSYTSFQNYLGRSNNKLWVLRISIHSGTPASYETCIHQQSAIDQQRRAPLLEKFLCNVQEHQYNDMK